ncbi:MAG: diaminopimelate epimerase, partial [Clostridia bacterium]|nr:diaminopimelate epimerase [Clostridia bacterium]
MKAEFYKMQSLGNDYIYFDLVTKRVSKKVLKYLVDNASQIAVNICKRKFSLGGDGIVLILPNPNYDATMIIYNSDGSRAKMCGNALRAVGYLLARLNKSHQQ